MKQFRIKDYTFLIAVALYSYLFYNQHFGINLLLFNVFLLGALIYEVPLKQWSRPLWAVAVGSFTTAIGVVIINSSLVIFANMASVILCLGYIEHTRSSIFISFLNGTYSILASPIIHLARKLQGEPKGADEKSIPTSRLRYFRFVTYALPIIITLVFLSLYANANPAFSEILSQLDFSFISWGWVWFTVGGMLLLFGRFYVTTIRELDQWDTQTGNDVIRIRKKKKTDFHPLSLKFELRTGLTLLVLLNLLLFVFNAMDISYVLGATLPEGVSHSEYVHQGVYTLIISIVLAILIIIYFFRGNLNFYRRNVTLLTLTYVWIAQNTILALGIAYKNSLYIEEYSLTYKRIGVFVYLFLVTSGLLTTYIKTRQKKNHWYLLRKNTWIAYLLLVAMSFVDWDYVITKVNLTKNGDIDYSYLLKLSDSGLPLLIEQRQHIHPHSHWLRNKQDDFTKKFQEVGWQSWNYRDYQIAKQLNIAK